MNMPILPKAIEHDEIFATIYLELITKSLYDWTTSDHIRFYAATGRLMPRLEADR